MKNLYIYKSGREFKRVNKKTAKKLYNDNKAVLLVPCNLNPNSFFIGLFDLRKNDDYASFEKAVSIFEYYNCINNETGHYAAFYIPNRTIDGDTNGDVTEHTTKFKEVYDIDFLQEV